MNGILGEFEANRVQYSIAEHKVYVAGVMIKSDAGFDFDISCKYGPLNFFFDIKRQCCLIVTKVSGVSLAERYNCQLIRFFMDGDLPVFTARLYEKQEEVMSKIYPEFREQYAAILLDGIING